VLFRERLPQAIALDEVKYEGDCRPALGHVGESWVRLWRGTVAGTYVGHGETYVIRRT